MLSRSMASLNTARGLNMQQYEIGITLLSQEVHTRESRSNTLARTIRAYELALLSPASRLTLRSLSLSLVDFPLAVYPMSSCSFAQPRRNMYREFISIEFTSPLNRRAPPSFVLVFASSEIGRRRLKF